MKKIIFIWFILFNGFCYGSRPALFNLLSLSYGVDYRFGNQFYNSFEILNEYYSSSKWMLSYQGVGLRYDNYKNNSYAASTKYFFTLKRHNYNYIIPFASISPVLFKQGIIKGMNIRPGIGVRGNTFDYSPSRLLDIGFIASYGYDVPVINKDEYKLSRHDFSISVSISLRLHFKMLYGKFK